jgi:hypothetical protein
MKNKFVNEKNSRKEVRKLIDFGYNPKETEHHFTLEFENEKVLLYECFNENSKILKAELNIEKFENIKDKLIDEFNKTLKENGIQQCKKKDIQNIKFERLLGKEMLLFFWIIEDMENNLNNLNICFTRWKNLTREERWYFCTMTNANDGHYLNRKGWRLGIKHCIGLG